MYTEKESIMKKLEEQKQELIGLGYGVIYIGVVGSQNYVLADDKSDLYSIAIVMPTIKNLIDKCSIYTTISKEDGCKIEIRDINNLLMCIKNGKPQYIEALHTEYFIEDDDFKIRDIFSKFEISIFSVYSLWRRKQRVLNRTFGNREEIIGKFGYDPRQIYHMIRLFHEIISIGSGGKFRSKILSGSNSELLLAAKNGLLLKEDVKEIEMTQTVYLNEFKNTKLYSVMRRDISTVNEALYECNTPIVNDMIYKYIQGSKNTEEVG